MLQSDQFIGTAPHPAVALVIAGVHGSELSGIEVANWIRVKLQTGPSRGIRPWFTTFVIPEVFPKQATLARSRALEEYNIGGIGAPKRYNREDSNFGRLIDGKVEPNRQFPRPGEPSAELGEQGESKQRI